jgi:GR25 family glycosyltransferase involved in LPS biosynthesis
MGSFFGRQEDNNIMLYRDYYISLRYKIHRMDNIDKIIYINLDRRKDRRTEIEGEFEKLGFDNYERFSAIDCNPGIVGCSMSHQAVMNIAKDRKYKNVLIIEDDFLFHVNRIEFESRINAFFNEGIKYDVLMLGYNINEGSTESVPGYSFIKRIVSAQTAVCYIINGEYLDKLIDLYNYSIPLLINTGEHWNYANDQVWKILQASDKWYCMSVKMGIQRSGFSDNAGCFMEYKT